jgi:hypothetical protein
MTWRNMGYPGNCAFWDAVRSERPDLCKAFHPWDRINDPAALAAMLLEGVVQTDEVVTEPDAQPLNSPQDFWTIALTTGYRGTIEQLDRETCERVRQAMLDYISKHSVRRRRYQCGLCDCAKTIAWSRGRSLVCRNFFLRSNSG